MLGYIGDEVHDIDELAPAVLGALPSADGGTGPRRPDAGRARRRVRALVGADRAVDQTGRSRRGEAGVGTA